MSRFAHKTKSSRKIIAYREWAEYMGVTKTTIINRLKKYKLLYKYDPRDIYSVFDFLIFMIGRKGRKLKKVAEENARLPEA
jgi:hypothetical protein